MSSIVLIAVMPVAVAVSVQVSVSGASSSSTAISDTFITGFSYVSSYTPLPKKKCFYFSS